MLSKDQIIQLNSKNISINNAHTKSVVKNLWDNASNYEKQQAVALGNYQSTKSFSPVKDNGKISVRMTVVLSQIFNVDPFYIIGKENINNGVNENILNRFLKSFGFKNLAKPSKESTANQKEQLKNLATTIIDSVSITNDLENLSEDEIIQLTKALTTQARLNSENSINKLYLIKLILAY